MSVNADRIVTVSTAQDTPANMQRFVQRNLKSGVDHMLVFLDTSQPNVEAALSSHPNVTVITTVEGYWQGERPFKYDARRRANAMLAAVVLATVPSVRWLFHLDPDEALSFDREALLRGDADVVRFPLMEAVATRETQDERHIRFKKAPSTEQLLALAGMGAIDEPELSSYYRGDPAGRFGVRPDLGLRLGIGAPLDADGEELPAEVPEHSHVLHYGSASLEDFTERWRFFGPKRVLQSDLPEDARNLGIAVRGLADHPVLSERLKARYLGQLFDRNVADDADALGLLDLLVDAPAATATPRGLPDDDLRGMELLLGALRTREKAPFESSAEAGAWVAALEKAVAGLTDETIAERVRRTVAEHRHRMGTVQES